MKYIITAVSITAAIVFFASGCYYDKRDLVYAPSNGSCDTASVTYSITIQSILAANCYSCHSGSASAGGGIALDSYNGVQPYIKNGQLVKDVAQTTGANPMPKGGAKLDNCSINKIIAWINKGAPGN
jgi:mono/diheme cytochrome c family protein